MAARRKLIVVSNRGPVSFARDENGQRVARRGGGGLVTALRSFVAQHDVTWIASAMTDEDRVVAAESGGEAIEEVARDGSSYRLRLVVHDAPLSVARAFTSDDWERLLAGAGFAPGAVSVEWFTPFRYGVGRSK